MDPLLLTSSCQDWQLADLLADLLPQMHHGIYIMGCIWQPVLTLQKQVGISCYSWIIRLVNRLLALCSHVRCNPLNPPIPPKHRHMTITNFNYEGSYLPGVICHIVVKADLGRSPGSWTPPQICQWWAIHWHMTYWKYMCSIRVHLKLPKFTPQVYSSSVPVRLSIGTSMCIVRGHVKVLKFTGQGYSSSLPVSFTPPFETVIEIRSSIGWSMCAVRAHLKQLAELGHLHNSFTLHKAVYSIIWYSAIEEVSSIFITYAQAGDMSSCQ